MLAAPKKKKTPSIILVDDVSSRNKSLLLKIAPFLWFSFLCFMSFEKTFAFCGFRISKGRNFRENDWKTRKTRKLMPAKVSALKVAKSTYWLSYIPATIYQGKNKTWMKFQEFIFVDMIYLEYIPFFATGWFSEQGEKYHIIKWQISITQGIYHQNYYVS